METLLQRAVRLEYEMIVTIIVRTLFTCSYIYLNNARIHHYGTYIVVNKTIIRGGNNIYEKESANKTHAAIKAIVSLYIRVSGKRL